MPALEDDNEALTELEEALRIRNVNLMLVAVDPLYDRLHGQPRFEGLLRQTGLRRSVTSALRRTRS